MITKVHSEIVGAMQNGNATKDVTLPSSFDLTRSIVIADFVYADQSNTRDNWRRVSLLNSTTVRLHRTTTNSQTMETGITVLEFAKLKTLQYVNSVFPSGTLGVSKTITAVDPDRAFAISAGCVDTVFGSGWTYTRPLCYLESATSVRFERTQVQGTQPDAYAWVVEV